MDFINRLCNQNRFNIKCLVDFMLSSYNHVKIENNLLNMKCSSFSILSLTFLFNFIEVISINQLKIMASPIEPFVIYNPNQNTLIGFDVKIIENFAKRFNFEAKFVTTNESLLEVFSSDNRTIHFLRSVEHLYELISRTHIQRLISN